MEKKREQISIVIIGHVDHGKSTILGRLLADTASLPEGKLDAVRAYCEKNSRVFEYAFLLDALKEEQSQGITIDAARCFFKTEKRDYLIIDAPGHFEFIKNMVTGASRADAAIVVIDAKEGIKENTKRHGYILSLLGLNYAVVVVNKMDMVDYNKTRFEQIKEEYSMFLNSVGITEVGFIPASGRDGENIVRKSPKMDWYHGLSLLEEIEGWEIRDVDMNMPLRFSVQDVYKFTSKDDDRRILAGTVDYGKIQTGDRVSFFPSMKSSVIHTIELFPGTTDYAEKGMSVGFTITDPFYISTGEIMTKENEYSTPKVSRRFSATIFWLESAPLLLNKSYKCRLGHQKVKIKVVDIESIIDATDPLNIQKKRQLDRYDIGEVTIESIKPLAFDIIKEFKKSARFVLIDQYRIAACAVINQALPDKAVALENEIAQREKKWKRGLVTVMDRERRNKHRGKFILFTGNSIDLLQSVALLLERRLFDDGNLSYFLSTESLASGLDSDLAVEEGDRTEEMRRLGEMARILTEAGLLFISYITDVDRYEIELLELLNSPSEILKIGIGVEKTSFNLDLTFDDNEPKKMVEEVIRYLKQSVILEYYI